MINDTKQTQTSGDNSTNLQAKTIVINKQGITYQEARDIALDVFKLNFIQLKAEALEKVNLRVEEFTNMFLKRLEEKSPEAINSLSEPSMQDALFTAQKAYAKTGDKDLSNTLVNILVERANQRQRNLKQIVLDESLSILPKLTNNQLDTLTVIFNIRYCRNGEVNSPLVLKSVLEKTLTPLIPNLSKEVSLYQHLEYTGCGSISIGSFSVEQCILNSYPGIFCKGFSKLEFETYCIGDFQKYGGLIIPCINDVNKFQVGVMDRNVLYIKGEEIGLNEADIGNLEPLLKNYQMSLPEVKEVLRSMGSFMNDLIEIWSSSNIQNVNLTSVGISLAIANFKVKIGSDADLGVWIK